MLKQDSLISPTQLTRYYDRSNIFTVFPETFFNEVSLFETGTDTGITSGES